MPTKFLDGRPLSPEELGRIRRDLDAFDTIGAISDQLRDIVVRNWLHLIAKLPRVEDERVVWKSARLRWRAEGGLASSESLACTRRSSVRT
jgi:hypothetical protein